MCEGEGWKVKGGGEGVNEGSCCWYVIKCEGEGVSGWL